MRHVLSPCSSQWPCVVAAAADPIDPHREHSCSVLAPYVEPHRLTLSLGALRFEGLCPGKPKVACAVPG